MFTEVDKSDEELKAGKVAGPDTPQQRQGAIRKHSQNYDKCQVNGKIKNAMQEVV